MTVAKILSPAKVNLALHVIGQKSNTYHILDSLVVFANVGDELSLAPHSGSIHLEVIGPESDNVPTGEENLVIQAAVLAGLTEGSLTLKKQLPVASGIGGGSSNAAAVFRLAQVIPEDNGKSLGADIPVCLFGQAARMRGTGDMIDPVINLPDLFSVLVNPRRQVSTSVIFETLTTKNNAPMSEMPSELNYQGFVDWLKLQRNDLQSPAMKYEPMIGRILDALAATGADVVRMSGSGATCFGLFSTKGRAQTACRDLSAHHPEWWIEPATLS